MNDLASTRQQWAVFCKTGYDVRNARLTKTQASQILDNALDVATIPGAIQKRKVAPKQDFSAIYNEAHNAGMTAGMNAVPQPMTVIERANPLDDKSPIVNVYPPVTDGVCGFAWVSFAGNTAWGRWAKKEDLASNHYPTGLCVWVSEFNQSLTRKEAYAQAFARILNQHGITAYPGSRMD